MVKVKEVPLSDSTDSVSGVSGGSISNSAVSPCFPTCFAVRCVSLRESGSPLVKVMVFFS